MFKITADELPRFMACNGSRLMAASVPPSPADDTTARDEGTAAHYMAVMAFRNEFTLSELVNRKAPNGVYMTEEMADHVGEYIDILNYSPHLSFNQVEVDTGHNGINWYVAGRADNISYYPQSGILRAVDFKYGHRIVSPQMHWSLISHIIGWLSQQPELPIDTRVQFGIYQPRGFHPDGAFRIWEIPLGALMPIKLQLYGALNAPTDIITTSPHCHKCPAVGTCPAARKAEYNAIDEIDHAFNDQINNADLSYMLDNLNRASDMLKTRLDALEEIAKHRITAGQVVDNYSTKLGYGNTRWKESITADILQTVTGKDLSSRKLVTPAEAKRQGVNPTIIEALTERLPTGVKLVRGKAHDNARRLLGDK